MKFALSWLQDYIDLVIPPHEIARLLTGLGLEVEEVGTAPVNFEGVIVAKIVEARPHPNADKLVLATISDGRSQYQVVCGAPNCRPGIKTAFAPIGAKLKDEKGAELLIKKAEIRGVESSGMLCSGQELGLSKEKNGIIEFAEYLSEGDELAKIYADVLFEVSLTPNLNHCANLIGIARELSAALDISIRLPEVLVEEIDQPIEQMIAIEVADQNLCPRYASRLVRNVKIGPSPEWMQRRLESAGIRPANNVVDITNYVLLEIGQPLHAFDYQKLSDKKLVVRSAKEGEAFVTLDGKMRKLSGQDLLICDGRGPIAIAGVMGGQNSEVGQATQDVLIESAYFSPQTVRRTSKRLGLQTEASRRFERGTDPNMTIWAVNRAAQLMHDLASGEVLMGVLDLKEKEFPEKIIQCRLSRVNQLLGTWLSVGEVEKIFQRLKLSYYWDGQDCFTVHAPTFRHDLKEEIDLVEEIARLWGYDNIPRHPLKYCTSDLSHVPMYLFEKQVTKHLVGDGLQEFLTCDLVGPMQLKIVGEGLWKDEGMIKVLNPTSLDQSILRTSLLPGLLQVVKYNTDRGNHNLGGFEVGRVHFKEEEERFGERSVVGILLSGKRHPLHWSLDEAECDFFDLKGIVQNLLTELGVPRVTFDKGELPYFHTGRQALIKIDSLDAGALGEIHPAVLRRLDVKQRIFFAELDLHHLMGCRKMISTMQAISPFPSSSRDWTLTVNEELEIGGLLELIRNSQTPLLESISLVGLFRSEALGKGRKNATLHFVYRDHEKTLLQTDVEAAHQKIIVKCEEWLKQEVS